MNEKQNGALESEGFLEKSGLAALAIDSRFRLFPLWELFFAFAIGLFFALLFYFGAFSKLENAALDFRFVQRGELGKSHDIVLVNITEDCIAKLGPWPWPRENHGKLLAQVRNAGAKTVAFDIIFNEPSIFGEKDDKEFADIIKASGRIILPQIIEKRILLDNETFEMIEKKVVDRPYLGLRDPLSVEGFIDLEYKNLNPDGVIRRLLLYNQVDDYLTVSFAIAAASDYLGINPRIDASGLRFADRFLPFYDAYESRAGHRIKSYILNYAGGSTHFNEISYSDVLEDRFNRGLFSNRLVIIGAKARGISEDVKFCPFGAIAGVEIHANLLHNILSRRVLNRSPVESSMVMIMLFAFGCGYLLWKSQGLVANLVCLGSAGVWGMFGVLAFNSDYIVEIMPIMLLLPVQWAITRLLQQFVMLGEKNYLLSRKVRELAIINEVSKAVSFMGDLNKTLDAILSRGVQVLGAQHGSLFMLDDKYEELVEKAVVFGVEGGGEVRTELKDQFKSGKGIAGEVFESGKPRLVRNAHRDKSFKAVLGEHSTLRSMICVPMMIKNRAIGVMNIVNRKDGQFSNDDLQTAVTIANQAAVVVEKARLYNLATIDGLTGLVVHRHFQAKFKEEFRRAKRYGKPLSFLMTDIDHFKKFNDTWGHQIGDMVLRDVASCVRACTRDTDMAARYGGEEFAVILPETELEGATLLAERLRQTVEDYVFKGPKSDLKVTISIGLSSLPENDVDSAKDLIRLADSALYVAKGNGRNRVETYVDPEADQPETDES